MCQLIQTLLPIISASPHISLFFTPFSPARFLVVSSLLYVSHHLQQIQSSTKQWNVLSDVWSIYAGTQAIGRKEWACCWIPNLWQQVALNLAQFKLEFSLLSWHGVKCVGFFFNLFYVLFPQNLYDSIKNEPFKIPEDDGNDLTHTFFNPDREGWLLKLGEFSSSPFFFGKIVNCLPN